MSDRKNTKNFRKPPETIAVERFKRLQENLAPQTQNEGYEMRGAPDFCREAQFKNYQSCSFGEPKV